MRSYHRRRSNELSASAKLNQLRELQSQLGIMIQDAKEYPFDDEESAISSLELDSSIHSAPSSFSTRQGTWKRDAAVHGSESVVLGKGVFEIETLHKPNCKQQQESLPVSHHSVSLMPTQNQSKVTPSLVKTNRSQATPQKTKAERKANTSQETTNHNSSTKDAKNGERDISSRSLKKNRWSSSQTIRNISRSLGRSRPSIFKTSASKGDVPALDLSKPLPQLPSYVFQQKDEDRDEGSRPSTKWWHAIFLFSLISMLACIITLWAPYPFGARMPSAMVAAMPWSDGCQWGLSSCICPRETICADDMLSMILLTIARSTAWFDYPLYMLLFMSKAKNLNNYLQKTALRCWINFSDYHRVHSLFGIIVGIESMSHSFFHILRWSLRQNDIQLLWTTSTGVTGFIAVIICPFIVLPMTVPFLKQRLSFEWRKGLHYLSIVWGACLMYHAPQRIFFLIGVPFFIYTADKMADVLLKTHLIESAHFQRLGDTSCIISFENPPGFGKQNSAYVYLMLPWLSKHQFHAFTVFPCNKPNHSSICIHKCGDWTQKLMKTITAPTHKPAFVVGPFLSPFSSPAMDSENLVAVASGIGVTPAISLIKQYSSTSRRLNLVWICRDAGLVEHFLQNVDFGNDNYTLIYYTGKDRSLILRDHLPPNVFIFDGRPNLERTISGIIASIATGEGLPEELHKKVLTRTPAEMRSKLLLEKAISIYTVDQLYSYTAKASNYYDEIQQQHLAGDAAVNYPGVLSTMKHLLGDDFELVADKITENFEKIDTNGDCRIDRDEFEHFFNLMLEGSNTQEASSIVDVKLGLQRMDTCRDLFGSTGHSVNSEERVDDEFGIKDHLRGDGKHSARNWNMLYCGGSQPVLDQLKAFKRKFGIGLSVEKFDW